MEFRRVLFRSESLQWLSHGLLVPAVMGGAISRSEAILRLHIPWVRIVIQVKALALATWAGWFGRWIFAEDSRQHESCDHGHAPPAKGSVGQRGDNKRHDTHERDSCDQRSEESRVGKEWGRT